MLKKIKTADLKIGERFSAPVFFDDGRNMLLLRGTPLSDDELNTLKRWKIQYVVTAGDPVPEGETLDDEIAELDEIEEVEAVEDAEEIEEDKEEYPINGTKIKRSEIEEISADCILKLTKDSRSMQLYTEYLEIIKKIEKIFENFKARQPVDNMPVSYHAKELIELVRKNPPLCVGFILGTELEEDSLARSSVNTAILTIILSEALDLPKNRINEITIAALLHDIGMMKIPQKILNKTDTLTDVEKQAVAAHTAYGYRTAMSELMYTREIALSIMQHHERWDGKGYPNGLSGKEIDIGARIITVADAFVAMITPKPYRDLMLGYQAMKNLLADNARIFDPEIIKVMIRSIGIYPIGSIVLMNDASLARVVKSSPEAPIRPFVRVLIDATGEVLNEDSEPLDLKKNKNLFIVRAIDPRAYRNK
ncbi:HD domain-containing phosphohydrolase [Treponema putidum]|uniref:HD-GYP domain-containing protein n=1 Tax=Treponema putidum TaxID=221027 RepID=A0AAE9MWQ7_9SPIR|nr:HD domain-containing phosphohydrolase [Treponema putidum]AIN92996.1 metal-dependent phosphohydrolase [Treponema putidum]TWI78468.1 HD-GYP domain-containing protein (c-di-GMP phosphodiesterase class II) [Treponema putidum]UTY29233.1 HD-GYP domain-containing protein [Treponema putidum]UTY31639.1 HD-GYP domain-containing protein [Treponema putidum]UTY34091.1 HD-GYP domain-containing protein [Treponema putidum]